MAERRLPTCDKPVGTKPSWMSDGQWEVDHCVCLREPNHEPPCACEHTPGWVSREFVEKVVLRGWPRPDLP